MTALVSILKWWESLDEFCSPQIAVGVLLRLTDHRNVLERYDPLFRDFLLEVVPINRLTGRVLAIRAVVDFWFVKAAGTDRTTPMLEAVEGSDPILKSLANNALGRIPMAEKQFETAFETWRKLRESTISDDALIEAERIEMLRRAF